MSTGLLQMMMEELSTRAKIDTNVTTNTIIAGPHFAEALVSASDRNLCYARKTTPLLSRYEQDIKSANKEKLYFPAHVNDNHWIAVQVDFAKQEYSYGKPSHALLFKLESHDIAQVIPWPENPHHLRE